MYAGAPGTEVLCFWLRDCAGFNLPNPISQSFVVCVAVATITFAGLMSLCTIGGFQVVKVGHRSTNLFSMDMFRCHGHQQKVVPLSCDHQ